MMYMYIYIYRERERDGVNITAYNIILYVNSKSGHRQPEHVHQHPAVDDLLRYGLPAQGAKTVGTNLPKNEHGFKQTHEHTKTNISCARTRRRSFACGQTCRSAPYDLSPARAARGNWWRRSAQHLVSDRHRLNGYFA